MVTLRVTLLLLVLLAAPASGVVIDSFDSPLPPNPTLPSGRAVLFLGALCDGAVCPPGPVVVNPDGLAEVSQSGLATVPQGVRYSMLRTEGPDAALDEARDEITGGALHVDVVGLNAADLESVYGGPNEQLGLDLIAEGGDRFELVVASDASSFAPIQVQLACYTINPAGTSSILAIGLATVSTPGTIAIPYSSFTVYPGATLHEVDQVNLQLTGIASGTSLRLEELRTAASPTPADRSSWGRLKAAYR